MGWRSQGAGDAEALLFAARYFYTPFADDGVEALGGAGEEGVGRRLVQGGEAFGVGGVGGYEAQVFADGAGEQLGVLGDENRFVRAGSSRSMAAPGMPL